VQIPGARVRAVVTVLVTMVTLMAIPDWDHRYDRDEVAIFRG